MNTQLWLNKKQKKRLAKYHWHPSCIVRKKTYCGKMEENSNDPHLAPWLINEKGTKDICKISSDTVVNTFASVKKKMKKNTEKKRKISSASTRQ